MTVPSGAGKNLGSAPASRSCATCAMVTGSREPAKPMAPWRATSCGRRPATGAKPPCQCRGKTTRRSNCLARPNGTCGKPVKLGIAAGIGNVARQVKGECFGHRQSNQDTLPLQMAAQDEPPKLWNGRANQHALATEDLGHSGNLGRNRAFQPRIDLLDPESLWPGGIPQRTGCGQRPCPGLIRGQFARAKIDRQHLWRARLGRSKRIRRDGCKAIHPKRSEGRNRSERSGQVIGDQNGDQSRHASHCSTWGTLVTCKSATNLSSPRFGVFPRN